MNVNWGKIKVSERKILSSWQLLTCMYTNSDQLLNKRDDLSFAIAGREPDVIMVTEANPKAQVLPIGTAVLAVPRCSMFTSFKPNTNSIGKSGTHDICIYI